jgi:5'-3' exonuclease
VNICSPDKDLAQVVAGDRVVLVDRIREVVIDEAGVLRRFGVPPRLIPDFLALVGDDADGVPGLAGFGARGTAAVLMAFGALDDIPDPPWPDTVAVRGGAKLATTLSAHRHEARLYKRLTTLVTNVALDAAVDDLRWRGPDPEALASLAVVLDDDALPARVEKVWTRHRQATVPSSLSTPSAPSTPVSPGAADHRRTHD